MGTSQPTYDRILWRGLPPYALMKSAVRDKRSVANHIEHTLEMDRQNLNALRSQLDGKHVLENCQAH
jgi:hypothetical protein